MKNNENYAQFPRWLKQIVDPVADVDEGDPTVAALIKESQELVSMIQIFSAKISVLRTKLNLICKHPRSQLYSSEHYRTDTLGNNGYTIYSIHCGICHKMVVEHSNH